MFFDPLKTAGSVVLLTVLGKWIAFAGLQTIFLHKNDRIIKDNENMSHALNEYFTNLTKTLKLKKSSSLKKKSLKHLLRHFKNHST